MTPFLSCRLFAVFRRLIPTALLALASTSGFCQGATSVVAWGDNSVLQTQVPPGISSAVRVAAGSLHSLALNRDGTVVGWGYDFFGQATPPPGLTNVIAVAAGASHSLALKTDGSLSG